MLVSPAEPLIIRNLGRVSSLPEKFGADLMWWTRGTRVGVQRKEVKDLRASAGDGRLGKELAQMATANLHTRLLVIEGRVEFDLSGNLIDRFGARWTNSQWWGVQWSVQQAGCWVGWTTGISETCELVQKFEKWTSKERHGSLGTRGKASSIWGTNPTDREYAVWVLQGIDGVGAELAGRIYDKFGGNPVTWNAKVNEEWLRGVEGVGKVKAAKIYRGLMTHEC